MANHQLICHKKLNRNSCINNKKDKVKETRCPVLHYNGENGCHDYQKNLKNVYSLASECIHVSIYVIVSWTNLYTVLNILYYIY